MALVFLYFHKDYSTSAGIDDPVRRRQFMERLDTIDPLISSEIEAWEDWL
ncbi:MAG: hypothetical protein VKN60_08635 [Cyanobacteriota bacterium]|nr:hypothetical protein [Cyanobacteriota bacterium]